MKVVFSSDFHLGLKTGEIDRTKEIILVIADVVKHCVKLKANKPSERVVLIFGGDIFNSNTPSEFLIGEFIRVLNLIRKNDIETYVLVGNHDAIADPKRLSCLNWIKKIKVGYPTITLIEDIKFLEMGVFDTGPLYFTFLPHITKALLASKKIEDTLVQDYINNKADEIMTKVGVGSQHIAFSHLNVRNVHGGSEENLLKKSEAYLPNCFINVPMSYVEPLIINGHIHSRMDEGNVKIIGSPIFCTFGEAETDKYFLEIDISGGMGDAPKLNYIPTKCLSFKQIEVDMISDDTPFFDRDDVNDFIDDLVDRKAVAKFDILISPQNNTYDWPQIRKEIMEETGATIKDIMPRVILKRPVKSAEQVVALHPSEAIKVYLMRNMKNDVPRMRKLYKRSMKYTQGAMDAN